MPSASLTKLKKKLKNNLHFHKLFFKKCINYLDLNYHSSGRFIWANPKISNTFSPTYFTEFCVFIINQTYG